jgi:hypothetical protein
VGGGERSAVIENFLWAGENNQSYRAGQRGHVKRMNVPWLSSHSLLLGLLLGQLSNPRQSRLKINGL